MIKVRSDSDKFNYDIHSLVQAFYPGEKVRVDFFPDEDVDIGIVKNEAKDTRIITIYRTGEAVETSVQTSRTTKETAPFLHEKNLLKMQLYEVLCKERKMELPWGSMTGIRPVKLVRQMMLDGNDDITINNILNNIYHMSTEKRALSLEIAKREQGVLSRRDFSDGYSLYVGIPFCPTRCGYCSFSAVPLHAFSDRVDAYLDCLFMELSEVSSLMHGRRLDTLYIGGGTPTTLTPAQSNRLLSFIAEHFDLSALLEYTVECGRPDSILEDLTKLAVLRDHGVDRICVNPQTMKQETLDLIGRHHTTEDTVRAFYAAREAGFDNINMDLILGLPGETADDVSRTMDGISLLLPDDLTVHALALKRGSFMQGEKAAADERARMNEMRTKRFAQASEPPRETEDPCQLQEEARRMREIAEEGARAMGLHPYYLYRQKNMAGNLENTGYAREGKEGITNILGMEEVQSIVACGAGAISKRVDKDGLIERNANMKDVTLYMEQIEAMKARKRRLFAGE